MVPMRSMPIWLGALLVGEVVLAFFLSVLIALASLAFLQQPSAGGLPVVAGIAVLPLLVTAGTAAFTLHLWRTASREAAILLACLPLVLAVPFLAMLFGLAF